MSKTLTLGALLLAMLLIVGQHAVSYIPLAFWKTPLAPTANWTQQAYVKSTNSDRNDAFGLNLAISGDVMIAGAYYEASTQNTISHGTLSSSINTAGTSGAAYIFNRTGTVWVQTAYLKASNTNARDWFGSAVAIDGTIAVVGAFGEASNQSFISQGTVASGDNSLTSAGAAYVFVQTGTLWAQSAYIKPSNPDMDDSFGNAFPGVISISGSTFVVGSPQEDSPQATISHGTLASGNGLTDSGATYVFGRSGTMRVQQAYIKASNRGGTDAFGISTALDGDTLVVGAYFEDANQTFISHGTVASGDNTAVNAGAAYVFVRTGTLWSQQAYLKASNAEAGDLFGSSVAISGDTVVVGASSEDSAQTYVTNGTLVTDDDSAPGAGAAYVFVRTGTLWTQQAYLKAMNSGGTDSFGHKVGISGDIAVVSAISEDSNQSTITNGTTASGDNSFSSAGAAYVFKRTGTTWQPEAYLKPANVAANFQYGYLLGIDGTTVVVAAAGEDSNQRFVTNGTAVSMNTTGTNSGAVYIYTR